MGHSSLLYASSVDKFLLYSIIVTVSNISLNEFEREFWYNDNNRSVIYSRDKLSTLIKGNGTVFEQSDKTITTRDIFEWIWREVGIQPGEYLVKRHNDSHRWNPDIEIRMTPEAYAYWKLQGIPQDWDQIESYQGVDKS